MNFKRLLKEELGGDVRTELEVWRAMFVSRRVLQHAHAQRLAALKNLLTAGLTSSDASVSRAATTYKELSELCGFLTGETDGRAADEGSDGENGSGASRGAEAA